MTLCPRKLWVAMGFILLLQTFWGCDYARMYDQESVRTYETSIPEMPEGTVPAQGGIQLLAHGQPKGLKNPLVYNPKTVEQGKQAYNYFCIQCHGPQADGNGTVGQSFAPLPSNLSKGVVQEQSDGELFHKISLGFKRHPPLASTVSAEDRWAAVNYIRSLKPRG